MKQLKVFVYPYMDGKRTYTVKGLTTLDCMIQIMDISNYGIDEEEEVTHTVESLIEVIEGSNGDGCDYIIQIEDVETGAILFEG